MSPILAKIRIMSSYGPRAENQYHDVEKDVATVSACHGFYVRIPI